jgi:GNAT superfamily N-acetyltransferase
MIVIEDQSTGKIVGAGTIFLERKFIHGCGSVGHIEDIVTDESVRGKGLGKLIIHKLIEFGKKNGAYKVLLSSLEKNVPFYEKCGLTPKSVSMALYLDK